ncbi:MAG: tRNA threonylcarbamoyladenosine dehydratase [Deltaproteobacteria bacterium]|nr:tRNA threonylcarbamoyladenosine dehydratase [Deltaproteobacteria bacterium]
MIQFHRLQLLIGQDAIKRLASARVLLLGVGGVGSWCAEALIRNGIGHLEIVDSDLVCVTNINRQLQALHSTVGQSKVKVLANRLSDINPAAIVIAHDMIYNHDTADDFALTEYDYIVDAIDSLAYKVELLDRTLQTDVPLISSMGAACKMDPAQIQLASFWKTHGCPLAKLVRKRLRYRKISKDFECVYSPENLPQHAATMACGSGMCVCPKTTAKGDSAHEWCSKKTIINGSSVHITGIFGFLMAGVVTNRLIC